MYQHGTIFSLTLTPGDGTTAIKVKSSAYRSAYSPGCKKAPRCIGGTITVQNTSLRRFDRNCVNIDYTEPPITTEQSLHRIPWWLTPVNGCAEINLNDPSLLPTLLCTLQCMWRTQKCITGTQTLPISKLGGWKHTTALHKSSEPNWHQALKHLR